MARKFLVAILILSVSLISATAWAGTWYAGVGFRNVSFGTDLDPDKGWRDVDNGYGLDLNLGYKFKPSYAIEVMAGQSEHDDDLFNQEMTYNWVEVGPKFFFNPASSVQLSLSLGGGYYKLEEDISDGFEGFGGYGGLNLEEQIGRHGLVLSGRFGYWYDSDLSFDVSYLSWGLYYNYYFGGK